MLDLMAGFVAELRNAGLPVSLTENLDAMEAIQHIPLEDREAFKYALGATLVKSNAHWKAFETVFEVYFSLRGPQYDIQPEDGDGRRIPGDDRPLARGGAMDAMSPEQMAELLYRALMDADDAVLSAVARQ